MFSMLSNRFPSQPRCKIILAVKVRTMIKNPNRDQILYDKRTRSHYFFLYNVSRISKFSNLFNDFRIHIGSWQRMLERKKKLSKLNFLCPLATGIRPLPSSELCLQQSRKMYKWPDIEDKVQTKMGLNIVDYI